MLGVDTSVGRCAVSASTVANSKHGFLGSLGNLLYLLRNETDRNLERQKNLEHETFDHARAETKMPKEQNRAYITLKGRP